MKINDKVTPTEGLYKGKPARVITKLIDNYFVIEFANGLRSYIDLPSGLKPFTSDDITNVLPGDVVIDGDGHERKVLDVGVNTFRARYIVHVEEGAVWSFEEVKYWKIKGGDTRKDKIGIDGTLYSIDEIITKCKGE